MVQPTSFQYEETDAIATITLDRPDTLNALTFEVYAELRDRLPRSPPDRATHTP